MLAIIPVALILASIFAVNAFAQKENTTNAKSCGGTCSKTSNCGLEGCKAATTGICNCQDGSCPCGCGGTCNGNCGGDTCTCGKWIPFYILRIQVEWELV